MTSLGAFLIYCYELVYTISEAPSTIKMKIKKISSSIKYCTKQVT